MKILWLFNHPAPYKVDFFNELGKSVDLTVLFERSSEGDRNRLFYHSKASNFRSITLKSMTFGPYNNLAFGWKKYLKDNYDVIVINGWSTFTEMSAIRYLKKRHIPYVFAINGGVIRPNESKSKRHLKISMISGAAYYLCPDEESEKYLLEYGAKKEAIRLFPYSTVYEKELVKAPLNAIEKASLKEELGLPNQDIYVSVGAYIERKNNLFLLNEIWPRVSKDKELYLIGDGPLENKYKEAIKRNGLNNAHLLPFQNKEMVLKYLAISELSLFLTKEDIYGHVLNESFSQGTPALASDHANSAHRLIKHKENGYRFSLHDTDGIVEAIETPVNETMRQAALETAKENTIETMASVHLELFKAMLKP